MRARDADPDPMSLREILTTTRSRHHDADETRYADRADIAAFNEARTDVERHRVVDGVRARARAAGLSRR
jgi:hypothetical protein